MKAKGSQPMSSKRLTLSLLLVANIGLLGLNILLFGLASHQARLSQGLFELIADLQQVVQPFLDVVL